jgi:hypothetical protein
MRLASRFARGRSGYHEKSWGRLDFMPSAFDLGRLDRRPLKNPRTVAVGSALARGRLWSDSIAMAH